MKDYISERLMSSEVETRNADFMENKSENESLRERLREIEDENQELRAQNLLQKRTILEMRDELVLMRIRLAKMAEAGGFLRERSRRYGQDGENQENDDGLGQIMAPPLMAPPPVPPPFPPTRVRITPRQVGAGEALTTPLGVSLSSPPRHRIKRDWRQGFCRSTRTPYRRLDNTEPGPSAPAPYFSGERPNYFVGLRIIPQFQTSFVCSQNQSSGYSDSASDSSGSDESPQMSKKAKSKNGESFFRKPPPFPKDFDILKNVRNLHHQRVRQTILKNYNLSLPETKSKFFFSIPWGKKDNENPTLPSTSGNEVRFPHTTSPNERIQGVGSGSRNATRISDCVQYTFPIIPEGVHATRVHSDIGQPSRLRKLKKNIPYVKPQEEGNIGTTEDSLGKLIQDKNQKNFEMSLGMDSESLSSVDERPRIPQSILFSEFSSDLEQDGFQADESSNCVTSNENSLEKICISDSTLEEQRRGE